MSSLREAICEAIFGVKYGPGTRSGAKAWDEQPAYVQAGYLEEADAVLVVVRQRIRDFPLNICGYGAPMPADHAASVEQFREAVLEALGGSDE